MPHSRRLAGCRAISIRKGSNTDLRFGAFLPAGLETRASLTAALSRRTTTRSSRGRFSKAVIVSIKDRFKTAAMVFLLLFSAVLTKRTHALCGARRTRDRARGAPLFRPCCPLGYVPGRRDHGCRG